MTPNVKTLGPIIFEEIKKAQNILLHCHPSPDPDSVGGTLAMKHALTAMGKNVTLIQGDSEIPKAFSGLPGVELIVKKNISEVDLASFDLFIIQDSASPMMVSRKEGLILPQTLKTIIIDHHVTNQKFAQINLIDSSYPAVCQIVYDLFKLWNVVITKDIAICLFLGMYTDSGGFKFSNTTRETLQAAAELGAIAPEYTKAIFIMENSNTVGQITFQGLALNSISAHFSNTVAISAISHKILQEKNIKPEEMKTDIASTLKSVIGWNIGISMVEEKAEKVKISFRTRDSEVYDVSKIAAALGGGGHKAAAGAFLEMPLVEAKRKVLDVIAHLHSELGNA
jgi:phosphoesterase RecJ-like protein